MSLVRLSPDILVAIYSSLVLCHVERAGHVSRIVVPVACVNRLLAAIFRARAPEMRRFVAPEIAAIRSAFIEEFMRDVLLHSNDAPDISAELHMGSCAITAQEVRTHFLGDFLQVIISTRRRTNRPDMPYQDLSMLDITFSDTIQRMSIEYVHRQRYATVQTLCLCACRNNDARHVLFAYVRVRV